MNEACSENVEVPEDYGQALRHMRDVDFIGSPRYMEQQWRANRDGAHPQILEFEEAMIRRFAKLGVPLFAHCVVRSPDDQNAAFVTGRSRIRGTDPYPHRFAAVDLIHGVMGWDMPVKAWDLIGHIGRETAARLNIRIVWGGDWDGDGDKTDQTLWDPAHFELAHWRTMQPEAPWLHYNPSK